MKELDSFSFFKPIFPGPGAHANNVAALLHNWLGACHHCIGGRKEGGGVGVGKGDEKAEDEVSQDLNCNYMYISFHLIKGKKSHQISFLASN